MPGYLSRPGGDGRRPGVVVLHDGFGIDEAARAQADWLAAPGTWPCRPVGFGGGRHRACRGCSVTCSLPGPDLRPGRRGAGVAGGPARMRRPARDRVLRHRRLRPADGRRARVLGLQRQLRPGRQERPARPARRLPDRGQLRRQGTASCGPRRSGSAGRCRHSGSTTTSRPGTPIATAKGKVALGHLSDSARSGLK